MKRILLILAAVFGAAVPALAQLTPVPFTLQQYFDNNGDPLSAGGMCVFRAGTSTLATTYTTAGGGTANANPLLFDSAGRPSSNGFFLVPGQSYKLVLVDFTNALGTPTCTPINGSTIWTQDNIEAVPGSAASVDIPDAVAGESIAAGDAVYLSNGAGSLNSGQWYRMDADLVYKSTSANMMGLAPAAIASGASGVVRINGSVTLAASLNVGAAYYASATTGAITSTPPTNAIRLGVASSATSLVVGYIAAPVGPRGPPCGRLTALTGVPVPSADVTAATTVFFTPYGGCNQIDLFDGTAWSRAAFAQISIAVPATTSTMYDVFAYDNAGVVSLEINSTTRTDNTGLTLQAGAYLKTGALTRLYLGSFRTTAVSGQTEDSVTKRLVWNYYNRVPRYLLQTDITVNWTYTLATWRQQRASTANQVELVTGVAESPLTLTTSVLVQNDTGSVSVNIGIGEDSTTAPVSAAAVGALTITANTINAGTTISASLWKIPAVGYHKYCTLESSTATGITTWVGASSTTAAQSTSSGTGMIGIIFG